MEAIQTIKLLQSSREKIAENARARRADLRRYCELQNYAQTSADLRQDQHFQSTYVVFYKVRRNSKWRDSYFDMLNCARGNVNIRFQDVIHELLKRTDRVEPSFSSKLIATIDPDRPIYDKIVLGHLGLSAPYSHNNPQKRLDVSINNYEKIDEHHKRVIADPAFQAEAANWDRIFPEFSNFTYMKKLDIMLWLLR